MEQADILVIGAGAAGLMAAMQLCRKGKKVTVLEARDRTGGRIHTWADDHFTEGVELGAEFVHGELPVTLALLKEANIPHPHAPGDMWRYHNGRFKKADQFLVHYDMLIKKLNALTEDITLDEFLNTHLKAKKYADTRDTLRRFAAGYDTADPSRFSVMALRSELQSEDDEHQYRVKGGYKTMISYLQEQIIKRGGTIHLSTAVKQIQWRPGEVTAIAADGRRFTAGKVIIALPLGVLQAGKHEQGAITFIPAIPQREQALQQMGMGAVIKLLFYFDEIFWEKQAMSKGASADVRHMGYLFSNEAIPTWWVQQPVVTPLLTGWLGGPPAAMLKDADDEHILQLGLTSLANIYGIPADTLRAKLKAHKIMNWLAQPFTRGSYSYATTATKAARQLLSSPEQQTLYFTGEAFYNGPEMGTVEAALANAVKVAGMIQ